jgi:signal transduction histidine kinase
LIESLLVLARADEGNPLVLGPVDLDDVAVDAAERIAQRAARQQVELEVTADERCPVRGDASWLLQLVMNLLENALRHTPSGGRISLRVAPEGDEVALVVADTGAGIAPEHLPRLFERFYRADVARSRATGGTGLGLAICAWIAEAHGGRLSVESDVDVGTSVTFRLPRVVAREASPAVTEPPLVESAAS